MATNAYIHSVPQCALTFGEAWANLRMFRAFSAVNLIALPNPFRFELELYLIRNSEGLESMPEHVLADTYNAWLDHILRRGTIANIQFKVEAPA